MRTEFAIYRRANDKSTIVAVHHSPTTKYVARRKSFAKNISSIRTRISCLLLPAAGAPGSFSPPHVSFPVLYGCSKFGDCNPVTGRPFHTSGIRRRADIYTRKRARIMDTRTRKLIEITYDSALPFMLCLRRAPRLHVCRPFYLRESTGKTSQYFRLQSEQHVESL